MDKEGSTAKRKNPSLKSSRPGSYLGYSLQSTRMCLHLCEAPRGAFVALEVLDDVDVVYADGRKMVEQSKSGIATNPITNFSKDLWKTFSNWIDAIEAGAIDLCKTRFRLYVLQKKDGAFAHNLHYAHTKPQVEQVVREIRKAYLDEQPEGCKPYIEKFLNYDSEKLVSLVIAFELETGNDQLVEGIKDHLSLAVPEDLLDDTCHAAIGWVKNTSDELIGAGQLAVLARSQFSDWMSTYNSRFSFNHLLKYTLPPPTSAEIEEGRPHALTLMRQLELIGMEGDSADAMSDYLQSKTNKVRWGERGLVYEPEFDDFKKRLLNKWQLFGKEIRLLHSSATDVDKGQLLHLRCMDSSAKLNDVDSPEFFVRGTYHDFSNRKDIGWHPQFSDLLDD
ncbi:ABC-three component system protein [Pseudomonas silesiensis]|uniref:ABC-three component system protein n=1 Tax=Pseudomonas silesiensis TaxID=1853130 RepID=UPI0034D6D6CB